MYLFVFYFWLAVHPGNLPHENYLVILFLLVDHRISISSHQTASFEIMFLKIGSVV